MNNRRKIKLGYQEAFDKCIIAFGQGLGSYKVQDNVVVGLRWRFLKNMDKAFKENPNAWEIQKTFILDCSTRIGSVTASKANSQGVLSVSWKDQVRDAVNIVIGPFQRPSGIWCGLPDEPEPPEIQ